MHHFIRPLLLAAACATPAAWATDLLQAWQAAQQNDRELAVARAAHGTAQPQRRPQPAATSAMADASYEAAEDAMGAWRLTPTGK